ncbi:hypothetical protein MSHO_27430 [Mycobacterium shottsii]|uniref:Uncharacterized protein n=1 Tax=Mycobacterium shottsii TaxID=133549 RepID=A0A7I7LC90_9MYCO|nr:hypothetical protein MSHO_27430 [Mycobacterium shottsii]
MAEYENASDGYADVVELQLPRELPTLAPGQEWRMVWDSALDRAEIGQGVESRFEGTVTPTTTVPTSRAGGDSGTGRDANCKRRWCSTGRRCRPSSGSS